jgi:hypothetical protein
VRKDCQGCFLIVEEFVELLQDREIDGSAAVSRVPQLEMKSGELHISIAFETNRSGRRLMYEERVGVPVRTSSGTDSNSSFA